MTRPVEVRVEKRFRHPPERVFDAFVDPARVGDWLFRTPGGVLERADYDPRPGCDFTVFERRGEDVAQHWGRFVEIDRPHRLVFDFWVEEASADQTRVTVAFTADGDGCRVVLIHDLEPAWARYVDRSVEGWMMILNNLETTMEPRP